MTLTVLVPNFSLKHYYLSGEFAKVAPIKGYLEPNFSKTIFKAKKY